MSRTCAKENTEQESKRLHLVMARWGHSQVQSTLQQQVKSLSTSPVRSGATTRFPDRQCIPEAQAWPLVNAFLSTLTIKALILKTPSNSWLKLLTSFYPALSFSIPIPNIKKKKKTEMSCDLFPMMEWCPWNINKEKGLCCAKSAGRPGNINCLQPLGKWEL